MEQIKYKGDCFYSFKNGVDVEDTEVQKMIDDAINGLIEDKLDHYMSATGNTIVIGMRYEDEVQIVVSKDYDEATILYENGIWEPVNYEIEDRRDYLEELSRSELIDLLLRSDYNPRKEV